LLIGYSIFRFSGYLSISPGIALFDLFIIFNVMFALTHIKGKFWGAISKRCKKATLGWLLEISQTKRKRDYLYR
jgi:hypothetical protein